MTRWPWLLRVGLAGLLLVLLGGCLRYHVDLTVSSDARVSGTVIFAIMTSDPDLARSTVGIPEDLRDKLTSEPYQQDGYIGEKVTLDRLTFDEVSRLFDSASRVRGSTSGAGAGPRPSATPGGSPAPSPSTTSSTAPAGGTAPSGSPAAGLPQNHSTFTFRRDGNRVHVQGETTFPFFAFSQTNKNFDARITLTFPGAIESTNGQRNGRSVTWVVAPDKPTRVEVVATLRNTRPAWVMWTVGGAGGAVALALLIGVLWLVRRHRAAALESAAPVFDAAQFQTFLDDRSWYPSGTPVGGAGMPGERPPQPSPPAPAGPPQQAPTPPAQAPPWSAPFPQPGHPGQPTAPGHGSPRPQPQPPGPPGPAPGGPAWPPGPGGLTGPGPQGYPGAPPRPDQPGWEAQGWPVQPSEPPQP